MKALLQTKKSPIAGAKCELLKLTTETYMKKHTQLSNAIDPCQPRLKFSALKVASTIDFL